MAPPRLETPRDLVRAVLRARTVEFPLRSLHRVPRAGTLEEVSVRATSHGYVSELYRFARDLVVVEGSAAGLAALGVHLLAQSVAFEDAAPTRLALAPLPADARACLEVFVAAPPGPRPVLRAPRYERTPVPRDPWRVERELDRPRLGLVVPGDPEGALGLDRRTAFTVGGTRGALRSLAFLLFALATDRGFEGEVALEGPEGFDNLATPSSEARLASPYWPWSAYYAAGGGEPAGG